MFKRLIKYLYWKYCDPDIESMTRKQLGLFNKPKQLESKEEQDIFYIEAQALTKNSALTFILDELVDEIENGIIYVTETKNIPFDRFSINGVSVLKERIEAYGSLAPDLTVEFDKYSIT